MGVPPISKAPGLHSSSTGTSEPLFILLPPPPAPHTLTPMQTTSYLGLDLLSRKPGVLVATGGGAGKNGNKSLTSFS